MPEVLHLLDLKNRWDGAKDFAEREAIWQEMLEIHADQIFSFGTVSAIPQPIVVSRRLMNVPEQALYNWDPGANFGMHRPDTFWLTE